MVEMKSEFTTSSRQHLSSRIVHHASEARNNIIEIATMKREILPVHHLTNWARLNGVELSNATVSSTILSPGGTSKGAGLVARTSISEDDLTKRVLLSVPSEIVLSKSRTRESRNVDRHLRDVLDAVDSFAEVGSDARDS